MNRFFCPSIDLRNDTILLTDGKEIHHLKDVLRLKIGHKIILFDGQGNEIEGTVESILPNRVAVRIEKHIEIPTPPIKIVLACAIPKKSKFETIIEKAVELGVDEIIPLLTHRTEFKLKKDAQKNKSKRYTEIAINAAKQSKRKIIPIIHEITHFDDAVQQITSEDTSFIPWLEGSRPELIQILPQIPVSQKRIIFFIGPEGDFTSDEVRIAQEKGATPVSLGKTVLKVETAAMLVVGLANLFFSYDK